MRTRQNARRPTGLGIAGGTGVADFLAMRLSHGNHRLVFQIHKLRNQLQRFLGAFGDASAASVTFVGVHYDEVFA
jgi:hypothetical protein